MGLEEKGMNGESEGEVKGGEISRGGTKPKAAGRKRRDGRRRKEGGIEGLHRQRLPQDFRWHPG